MDDHWEKCSAKYGAGKYAAILNDMVEHLRTSGLITTEKTVIDIGSGPGTFAEPISHFSKSILCTDISPGMLTRVESLKMPNVTTFRGDCLNLPDSCIRDVSFSSLCPPMNGPEGLKTMERLGKELCIYISSANPCGGLESKIWKALGKDYSYHGYDTSYPARYLKSLGIDADLRFFTQRNESEEDIATAENAMVAKISAYRPLTVDDEMIIRRTIENESEDGTVHTVSEFRMGMLVWKSGMTKLD